MSLNTGATGEEYLLAGITDRMTENYLKVNLKITSWLEILLCPCSPRNQSPFYKELHFMTNLPFKLL